MQASVDINSAIGRLSNLLDISETYLSSDIPTLLSAKDKDLVVSDREILTETLQQCKEAQSLGATHVVLYDESFYIINELAGLLVKTGHLKEV